MELVLRYGLDCVNPSFREVLKDVLSELKELFGDNLISVILFGSVARGDFKEGSDIDLLVVARNFPQKYSRRMDLLFPIAERVRDRIPGHPLQFYPLRVEEALKSRPIYLDLLTDAIILHDKDEFMTKVLKDLWKKLIKLGAKRIELEDGSWMWVLKPGLNVGEVIEI